MRTKTQNLNALLAEYKALKHKLFGDSIFCVMQDTPDWKRYNQLFQFFYPSFRTKDFVLPL